MTAARVLGEGIGRAAASREHESRKGGRPCFRFGRLVQHGIIVLHKIVLLPRVD